MKQICHEGFSVYGLADFIKSYSSFSKLNGYPYEVRGILTKEIGGRAKVRGNLLVRNNRVASDTSRLWYIKLLHIGQLNVGILAQITP